jgi:hypothetical protein
MENDKEVENNKIHLRISPTRNYDLKTPAQNRTDKQMQKVVVLNGVTMYLYIITQ